MSACRSVASDIAEVKGDIKQVGGLLTSEWQHHCRFTATRTLPQCRVPKTEDVRCCLDEHAAVQGDGCGPIHLLMLLMPMYFGCGAAAQRDAGAERTRRLGATAAPGEGAAAVEAGRRCGWRHPQGVTGGLLPPLCER